MRSTQWVATVLVLMGFASTWNLAGQAQTAGSMCQPRLAPQSGPLGYKMRDGSRCEGIYEGLVALGSLRPVSLVRADLPGPSGSYSLSWAGVPEKQEMRVQAVAFRRGLLYRMDTRRSVPEYMWPTEVLQDLKLQPSELGVIVTAENVRVNETPERVYLPVDLKPPAKNRRNIYILKVASPEDLSAVLLTVIGPAKNGKPGATIVLDRPLGRPYLSSATPIRFEIDLDGREAGFYQIRINGTRAANQRPTSTSFYMRHEQ